MSDRSETFRVLVRKFDPFEMAIAEQWRRFEKAEHSSLQLDAEPFDLHPLHQAIFEPDDEAGWDVAFLSSDWFAQAYAERTVADLSPWLAVNPPDNYPQGWARSLLDLHQFDGIVLGLPYHDGPECLIYRTDLFADANNQATFIAQYGRPLAVPKTWVEFHEIVRFFQRPGENLYGTVFAAFPDGHNTVYDFCLQLWTRGGELFDERGNIQVNTPQALDALYFYRTLLNDQSAIHPNCRDLDSVKAGLAFATGEVAMMINWFGFAGMAETIEESRVKGMVDVANIPHDPSGTPVSLNAYWILTINAQSPHRALAYRFLRFCASPAMEKLLTLTGGIGCRHSTWVDDEVNAEIPFYNRLAALHEHARALPRRRDWADLAAEIDQLVLAVINTDTSVETLLADADERLSQR